MEDKLIFETSRTKEDFISSFAFNVGEMIEDIIANRTNDLEHENKLLQAKILSFFNGLKGDIKLNYANHFGIITQYGNKS